MAKTKKNNIFSIIAKLLYYIVITFVCLLVIFLIYYIISAQLNADNEDYKPKISIYTIVSPSMTPVIKVYDVVVNVRVDSPQDIEVGDIITYVSKSSTSEGMTITHRVIAVNVLPDGTYEYTTQGDNNDEPDSSTVTYNQIIGKEVVIIPYVGRLQFLIANQKGWLFVLLIPVSIYTFVEIYKLISLFSLRKRVDEITTPVNDNKEAELLANNLRKEQIKEELNSHIIPKTAYIKSDEEDKGFLEEYNETIVNVKQNKYSKNPSFDDLKEVKVPTTKKEIEDYKSKSVEILDTDELTSKIKEYDDKIDELDKIMTNINQKEVEKEPNEVVEDNYLKGHKIKVTNAEVAKKQTPKKILPKEPYQDKAKPSIIDLSNDITPIEEGTIFEDIIPIDNSRLKIERPESEDITSAKERIIKETKEVPKEKKLNLNPKTVKKVSRTTPNHSTRRSRNLNLNPRNVKKVNRRPPKRPKKKLITIEKQ